RKCRKQKCGTRNVIKSPVFFFSALVVAAWVSGLYQSHHPGLCAFFRTLFPTLFRTLFRSPLRAPNLLCRREFSSGWRPQPALASFLPQHSPGAQARFSLLRFSLLRFSLLLLSFLLPSQILSPSLF